MDDNFDEVCVVCNFQKNILMTFITNIENVKHVILKKFLHDIIILKVKYYNDVEINMHVLRTWMLD